MNVLLISHTCQSRTEGQPKAYFLSRQPGIQLKVLIPERWRSYGAWRYAEQPDPGSFDAEIVRVSLPWAGPAQVYLHWYPKLARLLKEFRPDVIDLWEEPWGLVSAQACRLRNKLLPNCKIVSETEQNIDKKLPFPFENFRRYTLSNANFVVGRNREAVDIIRAKGFAGPAEVVPNAVDGELFRPLDRESCRKQLGVSGFVVGYVGRLVDAKGLHDLLEAIGTCGADVQLVMVGSGPLKDELEAAISTRGLGKRVKLMASRPLEELPLLMNAFDVLALPSRTTSSWKEQFGRVLIEAQACAVPNIGTSSGAIPDVVGEAGLLVPERDPRALAAAIRQLQANPDQAREMGAAGRRQVEARYTWARVATQMADIYRTVAGSRTLQSGGREPSSRSSIN